MLKTLEKLPVELGGNIVEVEWEIGDKYDSAGDGYCFFHHLTGTTIDGQSFEASGAVVCGELDEITDVEYIND